MHHHIFRANQLIVISIILLLTSFSSHSAQKKHMRGTRYCEIILKQSHANYAVYNSWGLNDCPEKIWNNITIDHVKQETGTSFAHLNGPRYWVIDGLINSNMINPTKKTIAGLQMREAGLLHLNRLDLLRASTNYREHAVDRHTTWIYQSGKPVYELIDPKGTVFVMQSYSIQKHPQTYLSLTQLGSKLTLPKGWQFKTGILKKTEQLQTINDRAIVIQDNFLNTYQRAPHDFLVAKEDILSTEK